MAARLSAIQGVEFAEVNFAASKLKISHKLNEDEIIASIKQAGYQGHLLEGKPLVKSERNLWLDNANLFAAVFFWLIGFLLTSYSHYFYLLAILLAAWKIAFKGLKSLLNKEMDMNFLMSVAVVGALAIGQWSEGAAVAVLFAIGEFLETLTMARTRHHLNDMLDLAPKTATVVSDGYERQIPVEDVVLSAFLLIRPGEGIPLDGKIVRGISSINEATITGESIPVTKTVGEKVFAGSFNENGLLEIQATSTANDTTLAKVRHLVEEAQGKKAHSEKIIDHFARVYTPLVTVAAFLTAAIPVLFFHQQINTWVYRALVMLVIACPCALVISTPVAVVAAIGNAAKKGILVKGGTFLENYARLKVIAFDKTGTLTVGKPSVTAILSDSPEELLRCAAAVEKGVTHPLALAILNYADDKGIVPYEITSFENHPGLGARAVANGKEILVGSKKYLIENSIDAIFNEQGNTIVGVAVNGEFLGQIIIEDILREESIKVIEEFSKKGIDTVMLTGDSNAVAEKIAAGIGVKKFFAELLPQDKQSLIRKFHTQGITAMVGDGINDAPALAEANIGMAMGKFGSDIAMEAADIVLIHDDLNSLIKLQLLAKRMVLTIKMNIAFSVGIKVIFMVLAILGYSNLWMAVFADTGTALLVTANGMRLSR